MTVFWIEDRDNHRVKAKDIVALVETPQRTIRLSAPFDGRINRVYVSKGMRLKGPVTLMSMTEDAPSDAPSAKADDAIPLDAPATHKRPKRPKPSAAKMTFIEKALCVSVLIVAAVAFDYVYDHMSPGPYEGPMSQARMLARQVDPELMKRTVSLESLSPGQGVLYLQAWDSPGSHWSCEASVVGANAAAFDSRCIGGSKRFDSLKPGQRPTGHFLYSRRMPGHVRVDVFPVRELNFWSQGSDENMVAIALLDPVGVDAASISDWTGTGGYVQIDPEAPPPFLVVNAAYAFEDGFEQSSAGCQYWADDRPEVDSRGRREAHEITLNPYCEVGRRGVLRTDTGSVRGLAGFYWTEAAVPLDYGGTGIREVRGQLLSSDDLAHLEEALAGETSKGAKSIQYSGDPILRERTIFLANACEENVAVTLFDPAERKFAVIDLGRGEHRPVAIEDLPADFVFSAGRGKEGTRTRSTT